MSDRQNGNGRAEEIGAPAGAWEKSVEFDIDLVQNVEGDSSSEPSLPSAAPLRAYFNAGHDLIALHAPGDKDAAGKPIGKAPLKNGWRTDASLSYGEAEAHMAGGRNVGVRLRDTDLVIDVDVRNFAEGDDPFARLKADFSLPEAPFVRTGGGGLHIYMRKPAEVAIVNGLPGYRGIEFKSLGRQVVAAGSVHPDTGKPYSLDADPLAISLSEAPEVTTALLEAIRKQTGEASSAKAGVVALDLLEEMLAEIDVMEYRDEEAWRELMMSCHHATAGSGRDQFIAWSTSDPNYADHEMTIGRRWDSLKLKPGSITVATLIAALPKERRREFIERTGKIEAADDFPDDIEGPQSLADIALAEVNSSHFTVLHGGKYLVGREGHHPTLGHIEVEWFPDHAVRSHLDSRIVSLDDGSNRPLGSWWVRHPRRRQYDGVVFDPSPERKHEHRYNLWRGWSVEPQAGDWSLMKRLVRDVLCRGDETAFDYVIRWAAFMIQRPDIPAEVALVFKGQKGVGKGTFARALKLLAGMHGKQVAQPEHFVGRFNEHLQDCILLFVDEGYWAGDKKAEGALKNLITEPVLSFEPKGRPIISGPNMLHIVIASNEDWIVPASADERRFAVFEADGDARRALPEHFFEALDTQMRGAGLNAMLHDLLAIELGSWHPRSHIPKTQALVDQKVQAFRRDPISFWWYRTLEDGEIGLTLSGDAWRTGEVDVSSRGKEELLLRLAEVARGMGRYGPFTKTAVARFLRIVGVEVDAKDKRGNRVWRVPRLVEARLAFERHVGGALDWDGD